MSKLSSELKTFVESVFSDYGAKTGDLDSVDFEISNRRVNSASGPRSNTECIENKIHHNIVPDHIHPLDPETNLRAAIVLLDKAEGLIEYYRSLYQVDQNSNFIESQLTGHEDPQFAVYNQNFVDNMDMPGRRSSLLVRIVDTLIDLLDYSRAAKSGAESVFNLKIKDSRNFHNFGLTATLREMRASLRSLSHLIGRQLLQQQTMSVPINLRTEVDTQGKLILPTNIWKADAANNIYNSSLQKSIFEFDLSECQSLADFDDPILRGVGALVVSDWVIRPPHQDNKYKRRTFFRPHFWQIKLRDDDGGFSASSYEEPLPIGETHFGGVPGSNQHEDFVWAENPSLTNVNPKRRWQVQINERSSFSKHVGPVRDIMLNLSIMAKAKV